MFQWLFSKPNTSSSSVPTAAPPAHAAGKDTPGALPPLVIDKANTSLSRPTIRELEQSLAELKRVALSLEQSESTLRARAITERCEAQRLSKDARTMDKARQALRRSKALDATADRVAQHSQIVYDRVIFVSQAQLNCDMVAALKASNDALRAMCSDKAVTVENVHAITAELDANTQQINELGDALTSGASRGMPEFDLAELDRELEALKSAEPIPDAVEPAAATAATAAVVVSSPLQTRPLAAEEDLHMHSLREALAAASLATTAAARALPPAKVSSVKAPAASAPKRVAAAPPAAVQGALDSRFLVSR
jgi:hypothetical protein